MFQWTPPLALMRSRQLHFPKASGTPESYDFVKLESVHFCTISCWPQMFSHCN
jgi:hypothetical protein